MLIQYDPVTTKGYNSRYRYFLEIQHTGDFRSFYAHLYRTLVNVGDLVKITEQIASVGNTGVLTGSHFHYEVRKGNRFLNPSGWCYCLFEMFKNELQTQVLFIYRTKLLILVEFY